MKNPCQKGANLYGAHYYYSLFIRLLGRCKLQNIVAVLLCLSMVASTFLIFSAPALATGSIILSPTSGQVGSTILYTLSGWTPSTNYTIWLDTNDNGIFDPGEGYRSRTLDGSGGDAYNITVNQAPGGIHYVRFDLSSNGTVDASAPFTITGKLYLIPNPAQGPPGTSVSAATNSNGFAASSSGYIWFDTDNDNAVDAGEPQAAVTTAANGTIASSGSISVPPVVAGAYQVRADIPDGDGIEASASFTVKLGINISPNTGVMDTVVTITVIGGCFTPNASGYIWFDTNNDSVMDASEPQVSITVSDVGAIPAGVTLDTPALLPNKIYQVRADIPAGTPIEASASFSTPAITTRLTVTKYDAHGNIIATTTKSYQWLEANEPVQGNGATKFYCEGPYFNTTDFNTLWDTSENGNNIDSRYYGEPKGTAVKDLCDLVGGASPGDTVTIKGSDDFAKVFDYDSIYSPPPALGKLVVCWYNTDFGGYVPTYDSGMRLIFFAETQNPQGKYVFGDWDMHETLPASRWYFYSGTSPSSSGLSVQYVYNIEIHEPNLVSCDASGKPKDNFAPGDTVYVKGLGLSHNTSYKIWLQDEPVLEKPLDSLDRPSSTNYVLNAANDPSGAQETVTTDGNGDFGPQAIWAIDSSATPHKYDIVADNQATGTIGTYKASEDAIDNPGWEGFAVTSISEIISLTATDYNNDGIKFGTVSPGMVDQPADGQPAQGAVTLTIGKETNVNVYVKVKGTDFSGPGTIPVGNVKYNDSNTPASAKTLTGDYVTWYSVSPPLSQNDVRQVYYWLSMPAGQVAGNYTSTFYYQAVKASS